MRPTIGSWWRKGSTSKRAAIDRERIHSRENGTVVTRECIRSQVILTIAGAALWLALSSCQLGGSSPPAQVGPVSLRVGESATISLYTHCGILAVTINGMAFYADPPLSDGNGNPPSGWGNPTDIGTVTLTTATTADFTDSKGNRAHFTSAPAGPAPTILPCF